MDILGVRGNSRELECGSGETWFRRHQRVRRCQLGGAETALWEPVWPGTPFSMSDREGRGHDVRGDSSWSQTPDADKKVLRRKPSGVPAFLTLKERVTKSEPPRLKGDLANISSWFRRSGLGLEVTLV